MSQLAELDAVRYERDKLRNAIRKHRDQKADDRCWLDDLQLYEAIGEPVPAECNQVGDKAAMLRNCERFLATRCAVGTWKSYADLEAERDRLMKVVEKLLWNFPDLDEILCQSRDEARELLNAAREAVAK